MPLAFSLQRSAFDLLLLFLNLKSLYIFRQFQLLQYQGPCQHREPQWWCQLQQSFDLIAFCCTTCYSLNNWRRHGRIRIRGVWNVVGVLSVPRRFSLRRLTFHSHRFTCGNGNCKCPCPISSTCTYHGTSCISDLNRGIGVGGAFDLVTLLNCLLLL